MNALWQERIADYRASPLACETARVLLTHKDTRRADVVDTVVLRYLRQKKNSISTSSQKHIAHMLHEINKNVEKKWYLKDFKQCHTYRYYMDVQITKFIKAINHSVVYMPIVLPTRHEMRCKTKA